MITTEQRKKFEYEDGKGWLWADYATLKTVHGVYHDSPDPNFWWAGNGIGWIPYTSNDHRRAEGMQENPSTHRVFSTGANRNPDNGKYDFEGFLSPAVLMAFGKYMEHHSHLADGTVRDSDNWQKGIPKDSYIKSMFRHFMDLWLIHRGHKAIRPEDGTEVTLDEALGGLLFNVQGYWHETLKERN